MQLSRKYFSHGSTGKAGLYRLLYWLVLINVTVELIGSAQHRNDLTIQRDPCASCYLVAHIPSLIPPVSADVLPSLTILNYQIALLTTYFFVAQQSYLIPHSQAPPRIFSPNY